MMRAAFGLRLLVVGATLACICQSAPAQAIEISRIEIYDDQQRPMQADVLLISPKQGDSPVRLGATNANGFREWSPASQCPPGYRLRLQAVAGRYMPKDIECDEARNPMKEKLSAWKTVEKLKDKFEEAVKSGDTGTALIIANDLAFRLAHLSIEVMREQSKLAEQANEPAIKILLDREIVARTSRQPEKGSELWSFQTYKLAGDLLKIETPVMYDTQKYKFVMTKDMADRIMTFQAGNQLPVNGKLDYNTVQKLTKSQIGNFIE